MYTNTRYKIMSSRNVMYTNTNTRYKIMSSRNVMLQSQVIKEPVLVMQTNVI